MKNLNLNTKRALKMSNLENRPLYGLTVIEFSQFLSGPYAGLRLADLGARVIKIERQIGRAHV